MCPERPEGWNCKQMIKNRPPVHRQAIQTGKCKKASQSLRPQAQRKPDHFLRRHVRRRKYFRSARARSAAAAADMVAVAVELMQRLAHLRAAAGLLGLQLRAAAALTLGLDLLAAAHQPQHIADDGQHDE